MKKAILNIKMQYETLSKSEKKIADFLFNNTKGILPFYITDLAQKCDVSEATIVRFAKKLGYDGYQQFKIAIALESDSRPIDDKINVEDSAFEIFSKVCNDIYCSLEKTKKSINIMALEECCNALIRADKILIFGLGNSASVAIDASHKMLRLGLNAHAFTDNHMQSIASAHTDENSVVIGISHSGSSKDIIQSLQTAKDNGATTIAITNIGKSPIDKVSDLILNTVSDETNYRILGLSSRIAQLALIDAVYSYLVCKLEKSSTLISKTESSLKNKKI